ncbi:MAG: hypothetical protein C0600_01395 [Ignavibacteria bacterium]|nr:MAG: hypothetical protein C0600_01395 [Ignavibacteria bacterium]
MPLHFVFYGMRYQQTPISRLSKAAKFLVSDGNWHPFMEEAGVFYRVQGKIVQRVRIEGGEAESLLQLFDNFPPLPSRVLKEGFREELHFTIEDDHYLLNGMLVRAYVGWDLLAMAAADLGVRLSFLGGNSLQCAILMEEWNTEQIIRTLLLAKAFSQVAAQLAVDAREGVPHIKSEISGLLRTAHEMQMEHIDLEKLRTKRQAQSQGKLFD